MTTIFFKRPEGSLAYTDYGGSGQPVLMLPGMGALRSEYRYLAPELVRAGFRAVVVDLRGQGESSVPWPDYDVPSIGGDILSLIDHLGVDSAHLIGTSKAAAAVIWASAERVKTARSLVLIGPFAHQVKINPIMGAVFWLMMNNPWRVNMWIKYYSTLYPTRKPPDFAEYLSQLRQNLVQPGRIDAAAAVGNASLQPSEERLGLVKSPVLVIMGTKDPDYPDPVAEAKYLAQQTGGRFELIEAAGHYPQTEMPEITNPVIVEFIKQSAAM